MKRVLLPIFMILCYYTGIGQTKKETVDWLNNKFGGKQTLIQESMYSYYGHLKVKEDGSFIYSETKFWKATGEEKTIITVNAKDLSTIVTSKTFDDITYFYVTCVSGECLTQYTDGKVYTLSSVAICYLNTYTDKTLIPRAIKALSHFIKICGGKNEVF